MCVSEVLKLDYNKQSITTNPSNFKDVIIFRNLAQKIGPLRTPGEKIGKRTRTQVKLTSVMENGFNVKI